MKPLYKHICTQCAYQCTIEDKDYYICHEPASEFCPDEITIVIRNGNKYKECSSYLVFKNINVSQFPPSAKHEIGIFFSWLARQKED